MKKEPAWVSNLEIAVQSSLCKSDAMRSLGLNPKNSGNFQTFDLWLRKKNINTSHFDIKKVLSIRSKESNRIQHILNKNIRLSDEEIFRENSGFGKGLIKKRFIEITEYKCKLCGNIGIHNDKKLILQLDHINGNRNDDRKENLRLLCPNCHSQTETFGNKRIEKKTIEKKSIVYKTKIQWPDKESLLKIIGTPSNFSNAGKILGVSDNAIRKHLKKIK